MSFVDQEDQDQYQDHDDLNQKSTIIFGKDREIFHASVDLKWVIQMLFSKQLWANVGKYACAMIGIKDVKKQQHEIGICILSYIRHISQKSTILIFNGDLEQAYHYARQKGKFILFYIEHGTINKKSENSIAHRYALADKFLGSFINENFVFVVSTTETASSQNILQQLSPKSSEKNFPKFFVLSPYDSISKTRMKASSARLFEKPIAILELSTTDIKASRILRFLEIVIHSKGDDLQSSFEEQSTDGNQEEEELKKWISVYFKKKVYVVSCKDQMRQNPIS